MTGLQRTDDLIADLAVRAGMPREQFWSVIQRTVIADTKATTEQVLAFLSVAREHGLNPLTREIYAFPAKSGGIQPIVSVDGWARIINEHPAFDGMTFEDHMDAEGRLAAITCRIYRKDRTHPVEVTEYMAECARNTEPWKRWPARMLRHKAMIQAARYAFGFAGIVDPDEAERIAEATERPRDERIAALRAVVRGEITTEPEPEPEAEKHGEDEQEAEHE